MNETVGVGELRQNLSKYLKRIEAGERFTVTDRNRPVAYLGPTLTSARERLIAEGRLIPASGPFTLPDPVRLEGEPNGLSRALEEVREE
jgi:prevent-host-death family protein